MVPTLLVLVVMAAAWTLVNRINTGATEAEANGPLVEEASSNDTVVLAAGKLNAANLETVAAQPQIIQHVHTVPGRLRYDQTKHVDVKAPMDGILAELLVSPGDHVRPGDLIAVIRSSEIGQARAEILKGQKELEIAEQILSREETLVKNLRQVAAMLDENKPVQVIESAFSELALGAYRQEILSAYAKMRLAEELIANIKPLVESGAVPGRLGREREADRQLAETAYHAARDEAVFEVEKAKLQAEADVAQAGRQLNLAWQSLETLLGYKENRTSVNLSDDEALSRLEIRAPFAGSIESRGVAKDERVERGSSLVVLANTEYLTVEASIREGDWSTVSLQPGARVSVMVPALEGQILEATIRYFGREVQADTNSVPLVAQIENSSGLLRPGMFVRVTVPIGEAQSTLSVRPESVIQHENQRFVFVETEKGSFKRVDVSTGLASDDWVEVKAGLLQGDMVVTNGAFLLKSELLLQGEGD
jgi:membrane fusion protein, heavy metal efflux system